MPATPPDLNSLMLQATQAEIYAAMLSIATTAGLATTAWLPGDPTRSLYLVESSELADLEAEAVGYIQSGFLDFATGQWLVILAYEMFGVVVPPATYATGNETLTNSGGGVYTIEAGDLTFACSTNPGVTYHNTTGGTLAGVGSTLTLTIVADASGSASSAAAGEIDTLETALIGVTCTNPAALVGLDIQSAGTTISQCRNKQGSFSPNGPVAAYDFVSLNNTLTGATTVVKTKSYPNSEYGTVQIYVASASGPVGSGDVALVQAAVQTYATPLCVTPTVTSATLLTVPIVYTLQLYSTVNQTSAQVAAAVQTALQNMFTARPIGGDILTQGGPGYLTLSLIEATIGGVFPGQTVSVGLFGPTTDTTLTQGQVLGLGAINASIVFINPP